MATTPSSNTGSAGNMETTKRRRATSEKSKYYHQCRQKRKTMASCKLYLDNRDAEKAAEVMALENWACAKGRDVCNCSVCRKKRGQQPTRFLAHTAEAPGFSSVSELLQSRSSEVAEAANKEDATTLIGSSGASRAPTSEESRHAKAGPSQRMETSRRPSNDQMDDGSNEEEGNECLGEHSKPEIVLPQGTPLTNIIGVDLPAEDFGHALQFLKFCNAFSKVLDIKEGEPEFIIQELTGGSGCPKEQSPSVPLHIKLFSLIQEDKGEDSSSFSSSEDSWFQAVGSLIDESRHRPSEFSLTNKDLLEYYDLDLSAKLRILNFLCDQALGTVALRNWICEENSKFDSRKTKPNKKLLRLKERNKISRRGSRMKPPRLRLLSEKEPLLRLTSMTILFPQSELRRRKLMQSC